MSSEDNITLCAANAYEEKYYFNQNFNGLPEAVAEELHAMTVLFTVECGGIFQIYFDENGSLKMSTEALESDAMYDEIGAALKIKKLQTEKEELFRNLELYYKVVFLGEDIEDK